MDDIGLGNSDSLGECVGVNATNPFEDGGDAGSAVVGRDVVSWIGVRSGSGWGGVGPGWGVDFASDSDVGFDTGSTVGLRSSSTTLSLRSEAVNWVGVRGGDGARSSGSVVITESRGSVEAVETGEGGSGSKVLVDSEFEKGLCSSWEVKEAHGSGEPDLGCANGFSNGLSSRARLEGASKSSNPSILKCAHRQMFSLGLQRDIRMDRRVQWQAVMMSESGVSPTLPLPRLWIQWPNSHSTPSPTTANMLVWRTNSSSMSSRERKRPGRSPCPPTITKSKPDYAKSANPSQYSVNEWVFHFPARALWFLCTEGCRSSRPTDLRLVPNQCCSWRGRGGGRGILFRRGGSGG